jgi:hypothetical protein
VNPDLEKNPNLAEKYYIPTLGEAVQALEWYEDLNFF